MTLVNLHFARAYSFTGKEGNQVDGVEIHYLPLVPRENRGRDIEAGSRSIVMKGPYRLASTIKMLESELAKKGLVKVDIESEQLADRTGNPYLRLTDIKPAVSANGAAVPA